MASARMRTEGGLTSDKLICPCVNRQKAHWWLGVARKKSWECRCAELTASKEDQSNRSASNPARADFPMKSFRSSCNSNSVSDSNETGAPDQGKSYFHGPEPLPIRISDYHNLPLTDTDITLICSLCHRGCSNGWPSLRSSSSWARTGPFFNPWPG